MTGNRWVWDEVDWILSLGVSLAEKWAGLTECRDDDGG